MWEVRPGEEGTVDDDDVITNAPNGCSSRGINVGYIFVTNLQRISGLRWFLSELLSPGRQ